MRFRLSMHCKWTGLLASTPGIGTPMTLTLAGYLVWQLDLDSSKRGVIFIHMGQCYKKMQNENDISILKFEFSVTGGVGAG